MATTKKKANRKKIAKKYTRSNPGKKKVTKSTAKKKVTKKSAAKKKVSKKKVASKKATRPNAGESPTKQTSGIPVFSATFEADLRQQLQELREHMENMFGHYFPDIPRLSEELKHSWDISAGSGKSLEMPALDIAETDDDYEMSMEIPGIDKDDLSIWVRDGMLNISASKRKKKEKKRKGTYVKESRQEQFSRSLRLPRGTNIKEIKAKLKKGTLVIRVPKRGTDKSRQQKIKVK